MLHVFVVGGLLIVSMLLLGFVAHVNGSAQVAIAIVAAVSYVMRVLVKRLTD